MPWYNKKIVETESYKEIWVYEIGIRVGKKSVETESVKKRKFEELSGLEKVEALKKKANYYENKRHEIKRLVDCNFDDKTTFLTLTYKENIVDIDESNSNFNKFIKRLKYYLKKNFDYQIDLKYIATWEKQKRGSIHYHIILFGFPFIPINDLQEIWGHGFIKINKIDHVEKENKGRYVSKYFAKDLDIKEHKKKAFFTSRNLRKPVENYEFVNNNDIGNIDHVIYQSEYKTKKKIGQEWYEGNVKYFVVKK